MRLTDISESNSSTILRWAIENNAKFKKNLGLADIISDDMHYILTLEDVNFLELYRLTEIYRTKIKIIKSHEIKEPSESFFKETFQGVDTEGHQFSQIAKESIEKFINIIKQIDANRRSGNFEQLLDLLLVPMICRTFTVQIPLRFIDFIFVCTDHELDQVFNRMYPETLNTIIDNEGLGFKNTVLIKIIKSIGIKPYEPKTIKYLDIIKFGSFKNNKDYNYDPVLLSFGKINKITGKTNKFSFFKSDKETLEKTLKQLKKNQEPLELEFAVQIPIEYLQQIQNSYEDDIIEIGYKSSFETIAKTGFDYNRIVKIRDYENEIDEPIDLYSTRVREAAAENILGVGMLLQNSNVQRDNVISLIDIFALLPAVYSTQVTLKVFSDQIRTLLKESNPFIKAIFTKINTQMTMLKNDMDKL